MSAKTTLLEKTQRVKQQHEEMASFKHSLIELNERLSFTNQNLDAHGNQILDRFTRDRN